MAMRLGADFLSSRLSVLDKSGTSLDIALVARALQLTRSTTGAETAFEILAKRRKETLGMLCKNSLLKRDTILSAFICIDSQKMKCMIYYQMEHFTGAMELMSFLLKTRFRTFRVHMDIIPNVTNPCQLDPPLLR